MKRRLGVLLALLMMILVTFTTTCAAFGEVYRYPAESDRHEGTWLTWYHPYVVENKDFPNPIHESLQAYSDQVGCAIVKALHTGEVVHIIVYNEFEKARVQKLLEAEKIDMRQIDFFICPSNDVWVRDTGPIFVLDENDRLVIANFTFDGWGNKQRHDLDNAIPQAVADAYGFDIVQIPELVLEGGAVECDGAGTLMAAKSCVVSPKRNPDKSLEEVEAILRKYLGVTNFIWIEGAIGEDITDAHIDGTARFVNDRQILVCGKEDYKTLFKTDPDESDWAILENAKNARGEPYAHVYLPLTQNSVVAYGIDLESRGSYINYYIGNDVVIVPQYNDPNDAIAIGIIESLYPGREVVGLDSAGLLYFGGMIHCITQQQPLVDAR